MLKKPIWSAIETTLFYYSGDMYNWSSLFQVIEVKERLRMTFKILTSKKNYQLKNIAANIGNVKQPSLGKTVTKLWIVSHQFLSSKIRVVMLWQLWQEIIHILRFDLQKAALHFRGCQPFFFVEYFFSRSNHKIHLLISFDLNGLKMGSAKYFENGLKSLHFFQGFIWPINLWQASKLIQIFLPEMCV